LDEDKKKAVPFVKSLSQRPTQVCNGNGWKDQIAQRYHVKSAPTFVLVDRNGVVRSGSFSPKNLSENVGKLLAEPRSEKSFEMDPVEIPLKMPSENVYRPHVGFKAPPIKGKTLEGELITPENLSGKVVVLDFWATWCAPCKEQTPGFKQMYFNHRLDSNFELIGVSLDKSILQLSLSVDKEKIPYKQICDQKAWEGELVKHYGVNSVPRNYLIDKNGIIRVKNMHPSDLGFAVRALLADKPLPDFVPKGSYKSESGTSPELEYGLELFAKYSLPGWGPGMLKELKQKPVDALKPSELEFVGGYDLWRMARRYEELKASP